MELKKGKTYDEQVVLLKSRGLSFASEPDAINILSSLNYYAFSGYLYAFRGCNDQYIPGTSFEKVYELYSFDRKFHSIILYALSSIELNLKSIFSYALFKKYPDEPEIYLNNIIYRNSDEFKKFKNIFKNAVKDNKSTPFVRHHFEKYEGHFPVWVAVDLLTLGNLFHMYRNFIVEIQNEISSKFHTNKSIFSSWLKNLKYARNLMAHHMRTYDYPLPFHPRRCSNHPISVPPSGRIFDDICVMKFLYPLSSKDDWNKYILVELKKLFSTYQETIELSAIGFPQNWTDVLTIQ